MESVSLISNVLSLREGTTANARQTAVAASAARNEKAVVNVLLEALQTSAYGANGQVPTAAVAGTRFAASA